MSPTPAVVLDNLKFFSVISIVIAAIIVVGWRQPLGYRFMSKAEIDAIENPSPIPAPPSPTPWMWDKSRNSKLDRPSYNRDYSAPRPYYQTGR